MALNRDLTRDETRRKKAMKVLNTMLSEDAQNRIIYDGQDLLSYSQDVELKLTEYLKDVKPVIEENCISASRQIGSDFRGKRILLKEIWHTAFSLL